MSAIFKISNAISFQVGWFICILTNTAMSTIFTLSYILSYFIYLYFFTKKPSLKREAFWIGLFIIVGFLCETLFFTSGVLYKTDPPLGNNSITFNGLIAPPAWLLCLWALFATSMRTSLEFMFRKASLAYVLMFVMAPCSYYAGAKLNTQVEIGQPLILHLFVIGLTWVAAFNCIYSLKHRYFQDIDYV